MARRFVLEPGSSQAAIKNPFLGRSFVMDLPLVFSSLAVCAIGLVILYSAVDQNNPLLLRQGVRLSVALLAFVVAAQVAPSTLRMWTPWIFVASVGLLLWALVDGAMVNGAQRWLDWGVIRFQPSEILKLSVPLMIAWYMHDRALPPNLLNLAVLACIIAVPTLLILRQPDLGTAALVFAAGALTVLLAGISLRLIALFSVIALAMAPVMWINMLDYQRARVLTFLNPESDPLGAGYNIIQSKIALGSGGLFGRGWLNGTQSHLEFLPERSTDFIFAVMGEEFGLLGLLLLLGLYLVVVGRGLFIAAQAQDNFGRLLAGGISLTFFLHVFVNAGMVCGLLPVVGVPLPLISLGGTSMVTLMAGLGILTAIHGNRRLLVT